MHFFYFFLLIFVCLFKKNSNFAACFSSRKWNTFPYDAVYIKITSSADEKH